MPRDTISDGFRGQAPHDVFQKYMEEIVSSPAFEGMPDSHYDDGRIQWEAPSNRAGGKFKDSHHRRRMWWANKAESLGISTLAARWISQVAKAIHPTKAKPCKKCGLVMDIRYVYPRSTLLRAVYRLPFVDGNFETSTTEDIFSLIARLHASYGTQALLALPALLKLRLDHPGTEASLDEWMSWLETSYIALEPTTLSPGAMSNAPDRFDGFHSFNRCCRSTADTGRSASNLRSYSTDRRVFEYWASGDWIAADRLMGILRRDFRDEQCLNGHPGPCQADHIGPISLGFDHRPHFQLLCGPCNSAKSNRMYPSDVAWLIEREYHGERVISWHSQRLWDLCKDKATTQETSLRLSKLLRDNRHSYMHALSEIARLGHTAFLASLLELSHADFEVEFVNLRIEDHKTKWDTIKYHRRDTKYAIEQKARRSRIAFTEMLTYFQKENRNALIVETDETKRLLAQVLFSLDKAKSFSALLDHAISTAVYGPLQESDERFKHVYATYDDFDFDNFRGIRELIALYMNEVGNELGARWKTERYTRELLPLIARMSVGPE